MNANKFTSLLIHVIALLHVLGIIIVIFPYIKFGAKSLLLTYPLLFISTLITVYFISKIKIVDKNNKNIKPFDNIMGNIVSIIGWSTILSFLINIIGVFILYSMNREIYKNIFIIFFNSIIIVLGIITTYKIVNK